MPFKVAAHDEHRPVSSRSLVHSRRHRCRRSPPGTGVCAGSEPARRRQELPYECGFEAFEDARMKFDVRYYLVAILFILFDLEIAFLLPWAVALRDVGGAGFAAVLIFLTDRKSVV